MVAYNHIFCYNELDDLQRRNCMEEKEIKVDDSKSKNNHKRAIILISVFAVIAAIIVIVLAVTLTKAESKPKLTVSETHMSVTYSEYLGYSATITGVAKNTSGQNLSYASVEFSVYDANGNNLGSALANINNLGNGDSWRFEAMLMSFPSSRPTKYKLVEITGYSF